MATVFVDAALPACDELAFAREQGWPVTEIDGGHLHQLHDPEGVADAIAGLAQVLA